MQSLVPLLGEQKAPGRVAVSPGAAGLLVVGLERARDRRVADGPHVGLVDPHAERVRRDDHRDLATHEPLLGRRSHRAIEPCVVGEHVLTQRVAQIDGQLLACRARAGVHDRGQGGALGQGRNDPPALVQPRPARHDREAQIRTIESRRHMHGVAQCQAARDVSGHPRGGGRSQRDRRPGAEPAGRVGERKVIRPKVVAPLRDAMGFVNDEQPDARAPDRIEEARQGEPLWRDVQQSHLAPNRSSDGVDILRAGSLRVDELDPAGRDPGQRLDLVVHQRDERRDDERQVVADQRGQLVAERLARARRHHDQRIAVLHRRRDRLGLPGAELLEPEDAAQGVARIHWAADDSDAIGGPLRPQQRAAASRADPAHGRQRPGTRPAENRHTAGTDPLRSRARLLCSTSQLGRRHGRIVTACISRVGPSSSCCSSCCISS